MGNHDREVLVSEHILVTYRHKDGVLAYRIPQQELERLQKLEHLVVVAREEIQQRIELGFKEETGELVVDRGAFERQQELRRRLVRPSRAREGKSPRVFVLSSRERRFVLSTWAKGESNDTAKARRIANKLIRRSWVILRRECQAMRNSHEWSPFRSLISREFTHFRCKLKIRTLFFLHRFNVIDARKSIAATFSDLTGLFLRKRVFQ